MNAPIRLFSYICELCIALAHRWQPERIFVILTAYLDESGTHGDSPVTVMAGVMANATQWARFEAKFAALKAKHGFRVFHTKKFKRRKGDFKGWDLLKQLSLMSDFAKLSENSFTEGVTFTLDNAEYEASYKGGDKPRRLRLESKYGLCFRNCLLFFILETVKRTREESQPPTLHFVLESGHPNWSEVRDIFNETKREIKALSGFDLLGNITFADKDECDPLMMADFLAHAAYLTARGDLPGAPNEQPFLERKIPQQPPDESGVTHLRFGPGGLTVLKDSLIEKLKARGGSAKRPASAG